MDMMILILILSILFMMFSFEWILIWIGMEINIMSFLSLFKKKNFFLTEFEFKYFLMQFIGSIFFLISFLWYNKFILFLSLMIKMNMMPFLFWIFSCLQWLSKINIIIFLTIQKIGPVFILWNFNFSFNHWILMYIFMNLIFSSWILMNKILMIEILIYSSIINSTYFIIFISVDVIYYYLYFLNYLFIVYIILKSINFKNSLYFFMILFLNLSGFPFSLMFVMKINLLNLMMYMSMNFWAFTFLIFSGILSYVYMKMMLMKFMKKKELKILYYYHYNKKFIFLYIFFLGSMMTF